MCIRDRRKNFIVHTLIGIPAVRYAVYFSTRKSECQGSLWCCQSTMAWRWPWKSFSADNSAGTYPPVVSGSLSLSLLAMFRLLRSLCLLYIYESRQCPIICPTLLETLLNMKPSYTSLTHTVCIDLHVQPDPWSRAPGSTKGLQPGWSGPRHTAAHLPRLHEPVSYTHLTLPTIYSV